MERLTTSARTTLRRRSGEASFRPPRLTWMDVSAGYAAKGCDAGKTHLGDGGADGGTDNDVVRRVDEEAGLPKRGDGRGNGREGARHCNEAARAVRKGGRARERGRQKSDGERDGDATRARIKSRRTRRATVAPGMLARNLGANVSSATDVTGGVSSPGVFLGMFGWEEGGDSADNHVQPTCTTAGGNQAVHRQRAPRLFPSRASSDDHKGQLCFVWLGPMGAAARGREGGWGARGQRSALSNLSVWHQRIWGR